MWHFMNQLHSWRTNHHVLSLRKRVRCNAQLKNHTENLYDPNICARIWSKRYSLDAVIPDISRCSIRTIIASSNLGYPGSLSALQNGYGRDDVTYSIVVALISKFPNGVLEFPVGRSFLHLAPDVDICPWRESKQVFKCLLFLERLNFLRTPLTSRIL